MSLSTPVEHQPVPVLIAEGKSKRDRWRHELPLGQRLVIGRDLGTWAVPWDETISRRHAEVRWHDGQLEVRRLPTGQNPIKFKGQRLDHFHARPGDQFEIGRTTFRLADALAGSTVALPPPDEKYEYSAVDLKGFRFKNAEERLELLSQLPELIRTAKTRAEAFERLVGLLLRGLPAAESVMLLTTRPTEKGGLSIRVFNVARRNEEAATTSSPPSERLIKAAKALRHTELHVWNQAGDSLSEAAAAGYTAVEDADWAFCTPLPDEFDEWSLYVSGRLGRGSSFSKREEQGWEPRDDVKFTELVASNLAALLHVRELARSRAILGQFFAPVVLDKLAGEDPETVLAPRYAEVSVVFCDLRGYSRHCEKNADDLLGLLDRVNGALELMTHQILDKGGVIGDFQGDSAMGFWGWPLDQPDAALLACRAALAVRAAMDEVLAAGKLPGDFRMGIGIAAGRAVAGRLGTRDQAKVSVFGPVVNLASRLESMTKILQAPILLDEPTAKAARGQFGPDQARFRRVAKVIPFGLKTPLVVTEVLPPPGTPGSLTDDDLGRYDEAYAAFTAGDWNAALTLLQQIAPDDRVKDFLMGHIIQHHRVPPEGWAGAIALTSKS